MQIAENEAGESPSSPIEEICNLHLLLLSLLLEVSGVLSGSHFLLLDVMMMFSFRLNHSMSSLINNKLN